MKITVLGSGTSGGVPVIGCSCPVCVSADPRDKRMRCSLYIEGPFGEKAVIDTGPEFRLQALRAGISRLDAVFLTHAHADHIHGLDDIRPLSYHVPHGIPVYGNRETINEFKERFSYIFKETQEGGGKPRINVHSVPAGRKIRLGSLVFTPIPVKHGDLDIFGWKIAAPQTPDGGKEQRSAVYLTDTSYIGTRSHDLIMDDENGGGKPALLVIGALRKRPHATHFSFDQALNEAARIGADKTFLTHLCHEHSHREIEDYCGLFAEKTGFSALPAWDGLTLSW